VEFEFDETLFFIVSWLIGCLASAVRSVRDGCVVDYCNLLAGSFAGGFFAFGTVSILLRYDSVGNSDRWFYLGVAALVGLLGKEQDKYSRIILSKLLKTLGLTDDNRPQ